MSMNDILNTVSAVSGVMTILGISGVTTWSLIDKRRASFEDNVIGVLAVTTKIALSGLVLLVVFLLAFITHIFAELAISGRGAVPSELWEPDFATAHLLGWVIAAIIWMPLLYLGIASVFSWSLSPFGRFYRALSRKGIDAKTKVE
jgi:hypothetical protein